MCDLITVAEFVASSYYCSFPNCCEVSNIGAKIQELIDQVGALFENYLGYSFCPTLQEEIFTGDDTFSKFLNVYPMIIDADNLVTISSRQVYGGSNISLYTSTYQTIQETAFITADKKTSLIRKQYPFFRQREYTINYTSGFTLIPKDIKVATMMMILNLAQRIDNQNINNPDFSVSGLKIDKAAAYSFGSSNLIKQVVVKNINELNGLPIPIISILNRYRINF